MKTLNKNARVTLALEGRFLESEGAPNDATREIPVLIIKEGMGNKADRHFYSAELLERVCQKFDGVKCYADHQTKHEETDQPERSIRKLVGYYSGPRIVTIEGKKAIAATLKVIEGKSYDWAWDLVKEAAAFAKKFKNKELVGVSINAWGKSHEEESADGIINFVDDFSEVQSADIVTQAGAGGGFRLREAVKKALHREAKPQGDKTMNADAMKNLGEGLKTLHDQIKGNPEHAQAYGPAMEALMGHHAEMCKADAPAGDGEVAAAADKEAPTTAEAKKEAERQAELSKDFVKMEEAYKAGKLSPVEKTLFETILTERAEKKVRENKASIEKAIRESGIPSAYASDLPLLCAGKSDEEIKTLVEARKSLVAMTGDRATGAGEGAAKGSAAKGTIAAKLAASGIKMKEVAKK